MKTDTFNPPLTKDEAIELAYCWASQVADDVTDGNNLLDSIRDILEPFAKDEGTPAVCPP